MKSVFTKPQCFGTQQIILNSIVIFTFIHTQINGQPKGFDDDYIVGHIIMVCME